MLKLPTHIRYGIRLVITLAQAKRRMNTNELAKKMDVSPLYLRQVAIPLEKNGIIQSTKGAKGGYQLNVDPEKTDLYTIVRAMNEDFSLLECVDCSDACPRSNACISRELWIGLSRALRNALQGMTLQTLIQEKIPTPFNEFSPDNLSETSHVQNA
jgi:Rrf2 family protein